MTDGICTFCWKNSLRTLVVSRASQSALLPFSPCELILGKCQQRRKLIYDIEHKIIFIYLFCSNIEDKGMPRMWGQGGQAGGVRIC